MSEIQRLRDRIEELEGILGVGKDDVTAYRQLLGISPDQAKVLGLLMKRTVTVTRASISTVLYGARPDCDIPADKIIDVLVCKLRKAIAASGASIRTDWGNGYSMTAADKTALRDYMAVRLLAVPA